MDKVKIQKTFHKIFSLLLATGLWFFVSSQGDATIKKTISNVNVTISGETDLTENGFAVLDKNLKVNVTVSGNRASLRRLNNKTLSANINVSSIKEKGIHMEASWTPVYNSAYVEGIHNLYEFDCGALSGWMYAVDGWYPNYGCSRYQLKDGEKVEWRYTCDLGRDVGCDWLAGS